MAGQNPGQGLGQYGGAISLASGLVSSYGSLYSGKSTANALQAQAALSMQNAQEAEAQGKFDELKQQIGSELKLGAMTANFGASGVSANSGSVQDMMIASTANSELDRLNILHGADIKSIQYENQAAMDNIGAQSALTGSYFQSAGAIMAAGAKSAAFGIAASPVATTPLSGSNDLSMPGIGDSYKSDNSHSYLGGSSYESLYGPVGSPGNPPAYSGSLSDWSSGSSGQAIYTPKESVD